MPQNCVTDGRTDRHRQKVPPTAKKKSKNLEYGKRFATSHVVGDYSREASGIRWLPAGGPAGRAWRGFFVSDDGVY